MSDNILDADDLFDEADDMFEQADDMFEQADEVLDSADDFVEDSSDMVAEEVDKTAQEPMHGQTAVAKPPKKPFMKSFTIFDGLLLIALVCVSLATLFLFLELTKFGSLTSGFPWRTTEFLNQ